MTTKEVKEELDRLTLISLHDDCDLNALQEFLDKNVYSKGMGVGSVEPLPLPSKYEAGQAFRLHLFYDEAYGAKYGGFCPQDCPYFDGIIGGKIKTR